MTDHPRGISSDRNSGIIVGGDNHGTITNHYTTDGGGQPPHQFHVVNRHATPFTDHLTLSLNLIMTACAIVSLMVAVAPAAGLLARGGRLKFVPTQVLHDGSSWAIAAILLSVTAALGWLFRGWLTKRKYAPWQAWGWVPEGREDKHGRVRLYLSKLRGTCAIDGSVMNPALLPTGELYRAPNGEQRREKELWMICKKERRHRGWVELTDTEAEH